MIITKHRIGILKLR